MKQKAVHLLSIFLFIQLFSCTSQNTTETPAPVQKYTERFRSQFHFTPPAGWMNDPNGLVFYEGEYHLFYQYNPDSSVTGPRHWGHAISKDLVHWEHLPTAIDPDEHGEIFSGSAVIDRNNTSGFGKEGDQPMVAIYTYNNDEREKNGDNDYQTQGLAYSLDKGRTWTKYKDNPIIENPGIKDFRDPNVFWYEPDRKWIMALAVQDHIEFYSSPNLIEWQKEGEFGKYMGAHGGVWECPNLFALKDSTGNFKWVLLASINPGGPLGGSATQYFIGDFNGKIFSPYDEKIRWLDYGTDNYAGITWNGIPESDGRRLFIGWMSNWMYGQQVPTTNWRSAMTLPRKLSLFSFDKNYELKSSPVDEIKTLYSDTIRFTKSISLPDSLFMLALGLKDEGNFELTLDNGNGEKTEIALDSGRFTFDRSKSGLTGFNSAFGSKHELDLKGLKVHDVKIFVDLSSIEVSLNDGERVFTNLVFPDRPYHIIIVKGDVDRSIIYTMKSIWKTPGYL